jgi:ABC-type uncharacterized transport system ATPase subunit
MTTPLLKLHDISKRFGQLLALDDASLSVRRGSIHALLGENGAGKTTLMRVAFGLIRPDSGSIEIDGARKSFSSPSEAIACGIGMVHQQFSLVPAMTVAENVALGGKGRFSPGQVAERLEEVASTTGLSLDPEIKVSALGAGERQKLEIIRTLANKARILILDEPTAVLTSRDKAELFRQLKSFAESGGAVVLITHKLDDALTHADEVTVLRRGKVVLNSTMAGVDRLALTSAMLGFTPEASEPAPADASHESVAVSLRDVMVGGHVSRQPVTLTIRRGEILGIAALDGGAAGLLRILAGRQKPETGSVELPSPIAFVPENRQEEAMIPEFDLTENFALRLSAERGGLIDWDAVEAEVSTAIEEFDVRASGPRAEGRTLSGGNQQRFVLARELLGDPPLLVLENPTQGLDVQAAASIHARIRVTAAKGTAVVFYSSDLDELASVSSRVLVVRASGSVFSEPERESIGHLLLDS